jgi:hypothetical protein
VTTRANSAPCASASRNVPTWTSGTEDVGARRVFAAKALSSNAFHSATPPISTPHNANEPSIAAGWYSARAVVIMPPIDSPQAIVMRGLPTWWRNSPSAASWSPMADSTAQPVPS